MINNADEFLDAYKTLEELLENRYRARGTAYASPINQYLSEDECQPFRDTLDLCRQVRNLLSHTADVKGEPPIVPSDALLDEFKRIVEYVARPPKALTRATLINKLLTAKLDDRALWLMRKMSERGFSHVPVMNGAVALGVFSVSTPFSELLTSESAPINSSTRLSDIAMLLAFERHDTERFVFLPEHATLPDAKRLFMPQAARQKRLAAAFITRNGRQSEPLIGMLTPWDVLAH